MSRPPVPTGWVVLLVFFAFSVALVPPSARAQAPSPYLDPALPVEARVDDLLGRMTLREKAGQMTQLNYQLVNPAGTMASLAVELDEDRLQSVLGACPVGSFLNGTAVPGAQYVAFQEALQRLNGEATRLGVPLLYGIDHVHGANYLDGATIFPQPLGIAATFDPAHAAAMARVTALEAAPLGHHWNFAPVLDLGLDVRWPRLYESFGEDPYLAAQLAHAFVEGLQAASDSTGWPMAGTAKHFIGYGAPHRGWDRTPAHIPDQALYEFHVPAFRAAIEAGIEAVMVNSGEVNGVPVHASRRLLTGLLRDELGFEGLVLTDWGDITKLVEMHGVAETEKEAARVAVEAGIDMSMTAMSLDFCHDIVALVEEGALDEARLDESVRRILRLKMRLGLFDRPVATREHLDRIGAAEHRAAARAAAEASLVLLTNDTLAAGPVLPLAGADGLEVLVAGPSAASRRNLAGGWTRQWLGAPEGDIPDGVPTLYAALRAALPEADVMLGDSLAGSPEALARFGTAAAAADVVVLAVGEAPYTEFVGNRIDGALPAEQRALVATAAATGTPVVLVVVAGRPPRMTPEIEAAAAVLWAGLPGFEGAGAIADVLAGQAMPSGRLPFSWPRGTSTQLAYHHKPSALYHFAREVDRYDALRHPVLFPFGHGLSYTSFAYRDLVLSDTTLTPDGTLTATVTVENTGPRAASLSVLWFVTDAVGRVTRPVRLLRHVDRLTLAPGEAQPLRFTIEPDRDLAYPDATGRPVLEPGRFVVHVGPHRAAFHLQP